MNKWQYLRQIKANLQSAHQQQLDEQRRVKTHLVNIKMQKQMLIIAKAYAKRH